MAEPSRCRTRKTPRAPHTASKHLAAAARVVARDALAGGHIHVRFRVVGRNAAAHPLLDLAGHCQEGLLDVAGILGRGLEERDPEAVGELLQNHACQRPPSHVMKHTPGTSYLCDCVLDHLLVRHIALVAYEQLVDALGGVSVNLLQPLLDVVEAVHVRDIVDDADAVGTPVVR